MMMLTKAFFTIFFVKLPVSKSRPKSLPLLNIEVKSHWSTPSFTVKAVKVEEIDPDWKDVFLNSFSKVATFYYFLTRAM